MKSERVINLITRSFHKFGVSKCLSIQHHQQQHLELQQQGKSFEPKKYGNVIIRLPRFAYQWLYINTQATKIFICLRIFSMSSRIWWIVRTMCHAQYKRPMVVISQKQKIMRARWNFDGTTAIIKKRKLPRKTIVSFG